MSVYKNMAFGLKLQKISKQEIDERIQHAANLLELTEYLHRKPKALSGGQRQRVALGRAIVRKPSVFLFDEPLSNLDAKLRNHMRVELKQLHRSLSTTMIYVTHDQVEAMTMADRMVVMNNGHIQQFDTPQVIYNQPANTFVATFIGSPAMNLINGVSNNGVFTSANKDITLPLQPPQSATTTNFTIGIRPENLVIEKDAADGALKGVIDEIEPLGASQVLHVACGNQRLVISTSSTKSYTHGDTIYIRCPQDHVHWFALPSGERLS